MSEDTSADVVVRAGDCPCPGTPHEEERITLAPALTLPVASGAFAAYAAADATIAAQQAALIGAYLPATIVAWTFTDEKSQPVPITRENMDRLLSWDRGGMEVADAADGRYSPTLIAPLERLISKRLPPTPKDDSTSVNPVSGRPLPEPSASFLPAATDGTPFEVPAP